MSSEELSREFYRRLGAKGLAGRTGPEWDAAIVDSLVELIPPGARVLDVGCGYGRITLALAGRGYRVEGLDHSPGAASGRARARRGRGPGRRLHARLDAQPRTRGFVL